MVTGGYGERPLAPRLIAAVECVNNRRPSRRLDRSSAAERGAEGQVSPNSVPTGGKIDSDLPTLGCAV